MGQVDFKNGGILRCILQSALPMLAAQILNLLYNIVDRIYIARIPGVGTAAIGAVGLCFPVIIMITAFTNLYGTGGAPLFSIASGRGDSARAERLMNTSFRLELTTAVILFAAGQLFCRPLLILFGASEQALSFAIPYLRIYLAGNIFSMVAAGMNPFINAQGFPLVGMTTVTLGAAANIALDPLFIFSFGLGIRGAAIATVLSQALSAVFVMRFLTGKRAVYRLVRYPFREFLHERRMILDIVGLGISSFVMQFTNSLVSIACNGVLSDVGGDTYISVMTIISSVRQIMDTPVMSLTEGASPFLSFNYGARSPRRVKKAIAIMTVMAFSYTLLAWIFIVCRPEMIISVFTSDRTLFKDAVPALHLYFFAFVFQSFQYAGQTAFKALGKKKHNVFFSLLRKVVIVIPLTYILPYVFHLGTDGVFMAEPVSNVIGGLACFITMLLTVLPELKRMEEI